ncbi:hypothetical protein DL765_003591 [Monosporascus sp. GIB2]|nr:hypothetical protein DL765_003591 [Monosporascus sp. GIB2]
MSRSPQEWYSSPWFCSLAFKLAITAIRQQPKDRGDDPARVVLHLSISQVQNALKGLKDEYEVYDTHLQMVVGAIDGLAGLAECFLAFIFFLSPLFFPVIMTPRTGLLISCVTGGKPDDGAEGGAKVVAEARRHEGVFVRRGKEDHLLTRSIAPRTEVYDEKRTSVDSTTKDADDPFLSPIIFPVTKTFLSPDHKDLGIAVALQAEVWIVRYEEPFLDSDFSLPDSTSIIHSPSTRVKAETSDALSELEEEPELPSGAGPVIRENIPLVRAGVSSEEVWQASRLY